MSKVKIISLTFSSILVIVILHVLSDFGHITEIMQWSSPKDKYALSVIKRRSHIDLFGLHEHHMIVIGRVGAVPGYGHPKDYSFIHGYPEFNKYIKKCTVQWSPEGCTFIEPEGHKLFFPISVYSRGR
jgi:hypothetical protein